MAKKVIGVFDTETEAIEAINNLKAHGHDPNDISIVTKNIHDATWLRGETNLEPTTPENFQSRSEKQDEDESFWEKLKSFFTTESNEYDTTDGYTSRFKQYGLTNEEAEHYQREIQLGKIVILASESIEETAYATDAPINQKEQTQRQPERKLKLREEELDVHTKEVPSGEAEIKKEVYEDTKQIDVPVTREEVYVEEKPVNKEETSDSVDQIGDETLRIPLREEEVEVRKRPVVKEEVEIGKKKVQDTERISDRLKREELDFEIDNKERSDKSEYSRTGSDMVYLEDENESEKRRNERINRFLDEENDRRS